MIKEISKEHFVNLDRLDDKSIVVDAGAAWGDTIKDLRTYRQTAKCRIFAIECNKDHIKTLREENFRNVTICRKALVGQDRPDEITFYQHLGLPGWGNIVKPRGEYHRKFKGIKAYKVKTLKINDIFHGLRVDRIDFLKMDIEGSEKEVLETMSRETASKIKQLSVEFHFPLDVTREYMEHLIEEFGFEIKINKDYEVFCERRE